jgi:glycosyl transferase family 87
MMDRPIALPRTPPVRITLGALIVLAAITVGVHMRSTAPHNDFTQDYVAARALTHGDEPYAPTDVLVRRYMGPRTDFSPPPGQRDPHPPPLILLLAPLSFLPYAAAWTLWKIVIVLGFAGSIALIAHIIGFPRNDSLMIGAVSLVVPSAQQELIYGGTTVVVLVLLALTWWRLERAPETSAGVLAGAAAALKLFPSLLVVWFAKQRRARAATTMVTAAVLITLVSLAFFGAHGVRAFLTASNDDFHRYRASPINMSLPAMAFRILHGAPATGLAIAIAAVGLAIAWRSRGNLSGPFWSAVPWMILLSPLAWYASLMIPVVFVAAVRLSRAGRLRAWHLLLFAASCFGTVASAGSQSAGTGTKLNDLIPTIAVAVFAVMDAWPNRAAVDA